MSVPSYLKGKDGLIIGSDDKNKCVIDGYQHVLLLAPTGAGKGVSCVLPNLLSYDESVIVHDIKLENFALTSGYRQSTGQKIYLFEPLNPEGKTHCYNPLDFVRKDPDHMVDDIQNIANILIPDSKDFNAKNLFVTLALYLLTSDSKTKSFGEIFRILMGDLADELAKAAMKPNTHNLTKLLINNFLGKSEKLQSKIVSSLAQYLELWSNPFVDKATEKSDFNPLDFRKKKSTLYVGLQPADVDRLKPLLQLFYQLLFQNICKAHVPDSNGLLVMLDDFPSIGRMNILLTCLPFLRGYKVRLLLVAQDINRIKMSYCERGTQAILNNSSFKIVYRANDIETAEMVSSLSLMKTSEVITLPKEMQIVMAEYEKTHMLKKENYYDNDEYKKRIIDQAKLEF